MSTESKASRGTTSNSRRIPLAAMSVLLGVAVGALCVAAYFTYAFTFMTWSGM